MGLFALMYAFTAISGGTQVAGQIHAAGQAKKAGRAEQEAANDQADLMGENAAIADQQAADAIARGAQEEARFRDSVDGIVGAQRAAEAASNLDVGFGSALDVQHDARHLGELDALQIRTNAAREAWGYTVQGNDLRKRAAITRKSGKAAAAAANAEATGHYLGAVNTGFNMANSLTRMRYGQKTGETPGS